MPNPPPRRKLRIGALFAGYGGLDIAVMQLYPNADLVWYADICRDPSDGKGAHLEPHGSPCTILAHHHPDLPNIGDVSAVKWTPDCPDCGAPTWTTWTAFDLPVYSCTTCVRDWPETIRDADPDADRIPAPVNIITGGSPCQDLSAAGKRAGMTEGTRSNLWVAMREGIARLRPQLVVWENVRGAYSAEASSELVTRPGLLDGVRVRRGQPVLRALGRVVGDLSDLRYDAAWHGVRAADVDFCHGRFRVFLAAADTEGDTWWLRDGDGEAVEDPDVAARGERGVAAPEPAALLPTPRATDGTKGGPNQRGTSGDLMLPSAVVQLLGTPRASEWKGSGPPGSRSHDHMLEREYLSAQVLMLPTPTTDPDSHNGHARNLNAEAQRLLPTPSVADVTGGHKHRSGARSDELLLNGVAAHETWGDYAAAIARHERALGREAPPATMTSTLGNPQLSHYFVEWMQGLDEGHVTGVPGITRNQALKALGNGVVPQQAVYGLTLSVGALTRSWGV